MIHFQFNPELSLAKKLCSVILSSFILCTAQAAEPPKIIRFWLIDAATDTRITEIHQDPAQSFPLPFLPDHLSIEAETNSVTESVVMKIDGIRSSMENAAPYALNGDDRGDFTPVSDLRTAGRVRISAQPFSEDEAEGEEGQELSLAISFYRPDFIVGNIDDISDANPGDGLCSISAVGSPENCTLRAAIEEANALPGYQKIVVDGSRGDYRLSEGTLRITDPVSIQGHQLPVIDAGGDSRVFYIVGPSEFSSILVHLQGLDIARGSGDSVVGGGILAQWAILQVADSIVRDNRANRGGGIGITQGVTLSIIRSAINNNIAGHPDSFRGGGITQTGGGIHINHPSNFISIHDSSIFDNRAVRGGGIYQGSGTVKIENSSVIGNEAVTLGGGIANRRGSLIINDSTITKNRAGGSYRLSRADAISVGGGGLFNTGRVRMRNSIMTGNTVENNIGNPLTGGVKLEGPDCYSSDDSDFRSRRRNVIGVGDSCNVSGSILQFTASLTPRLYQGHLAYHAPTASSVAIENASRCSENHDMIGNPRPAGPQCDLGAIEFQPESTEPPSEESTFSSTMKAEHSGKCLDIKRGSIDKGAKAIQYSCNGDLNQLFEFIPVDGNAQTYTIKAHHSDHCLDIKRSSKRKGARLVQWQCGNHKRNQQFKLLPVENNIFQIQAVHSGLCLDVKKKRIKNKAKIHQWSCKPPSSSNPVNQYWALEGYRE